MARLAGSRASCSAPPSPASSGAEREHRGEQQRLVHAERADHLAVLRRRAHEPAEARACAAARCSAISTSGPSDDQEQVVARQAAAEDLDRAAQARRARPEQVLRAPDRTAPRR